MTHSDRLAQVLRSAARLQEVVPEAVLVGGTAAALHAGHRLSMDHDHVLDDLVERYAEIVEAVEASEGWVTSIRASSPPLTLLGSLDGIEAGLRQLRRTRPLEVEEVDLGGGDVVRVPTLPEMLRVKAYLIVQRNATRDYLDTAALIEALTTWDASRLGSLVAGSAAAGLFDADASRALASTRFIIASHLKAFAHLRPGDFGLRQWLQSGRGNLFLTWREDMNAALAPLLACWIDLLCTAALSQPPEPGRRLWLILDELASLGKISSLEAALTKGRKHGLCCVAGVQSTAQLERIYGREGAIVLCEGTAEEPLTLRGSTHLHLHELLPAVAAAWAFGLAPALLAAGIDTFDVHTCAETH